MPKKLMTKLAAEYGISLEEMQDITFNHLSENMLSGSRGLVWIDEQGQEIIEQSVQCAPQVFRGKVLRECPNRKFVMATGEGILSLNTVKIPRQLIGRLKGKVIHYEKNSSDEYYDYIKSPEPQRKN